jgi:hypothetical protein
MPITRELPVCGKDQSAADLLESKMEEAAGLMTGYFNVDFAANMIREAACAITAPIGDVLASARASPSRWRRHDGR